MMCENCGQRGVEIHLVKIINGVRIEENICRQCAKEMMPFHEEEKALKMSFSLEGIMSTGDALKNLLFPMMPELYEIEYREMKCPHCGKDIAPDELFHKNRDKSTECGNSVLDFSRTEGDPGAAHKTSYEGSAAQAQTVAPDLKTENFTEPAEKELVKLTKELELVLRSEKYERAAEIRDRVAELQKIISEESEEV